MSVSMLRYGALVLGTTLAPVFVQPAAAQLLEQKSLSSAIAITMAQTAIATCTASGYRVSVTVVGRTGEVILQVRGDNASPHTVENSQRKAYTARTCTTSGDWAENLTKIPIAGSVPHRRAAISAPDQGREEVIGAIGVSGAPVAKRTRSAPRLQSTRWLIS